MSEKKEQSSEIDAMVQAGLGIASALGKATLSLGGTLPHIRGNAKQAAMNMLNVAQQVDVVRAAIVELANSVVDWDVQSVKPVSNNKLVGPDGKPL